MKIALLGLHTDSNYGDPLICQCVEKLYNDELHGADWIHINLRRYFNLEERSFFVRVYKLIYSYAKRDLKKESLKVKVCTFILSLLFLKYTRNCNLGIIAGGGIIHYKHHDYALGIAAFIKACKYRNIPVIVNAVGIEGYDDNNIKCKTISKALRKNNVKAITTRDDINTLKEKYLKNKQVNFISKTIDPAIFAKDVFNVHRDPSSDIVGIGLIRYNVFSDYKVNYSPNQLTEYYCGLVEELEKRDTPYEFFVNGYQEDLNIVPMLEERLGRKVNVIVPQSAGELVETISHYKAIITARMHSCIVAYSLNIPAVAFVWCEKLAFWGKTINRESCFIPMEELTPIRAITEIENAITVGYDKKRRVALETNCIQIIKDAINASLK